MAQRGFRGLDSDSDLRVLDRVRRSSFGVSAIDIAKASLGHRARKRSPSSLTMVGLAIATRLIGQGQLKATKSNLFTSVDGAPR